jgi:para-nitrobenzyl esterase
MVARRLRTLAALTAAGAILFVTGQACAQVHGTATYRERIALPPEAIFEATLEDVSRADAKADVIGKAIERPGNPPFAFEILYDASKIDPKRRYVVRARILMGNTLLFTTDQHYPVLTSGNGNEVALTLRRIGQAPGDSPIMATLEDGTVRGVLANSVISWKGIPYAAAPVGELRWRNPQPALPWTGVKDTNRFGPACMQTDNVPKSEDCLTLNVWRPAQAPARPLPVMVWMHGGAMVHGSASLYPFDAMAAKGVMVVSMNFRLGRFGYFAHPALGAEAPDDVRGNYGFMDQLAALRWVQNNIAAFGGNPDEVTIFGESAGGGSVLAHLVSPMSRGLFQRAILQSPGTPGPRARAIPSSDLATAEKIATDWSRSVGVTGEGVAALKELRALPAAKLLEGVSGAATLKALAADTTPPGMAMSIIDGRFLTERPEAALAAGRQAVVPVIIGANDRDLALGSASTKYELFGLFGPDADKARRLYDPLGDSTLDELKQQVFADRTLVEPARHLANEMARTGQTVWLYRFAYVSEAQRGQNMGALHGYEIPFAMNVPAALVGPKKVTPTDQAMADLVSAYWVSFGLTTDPNGGGRPMWPRHDRDVDRLMHFTNSGVIVGTDPLKPRLDLWQRAWTRDR